MIPRLRSRILRICMKVVMLGLATRRGRCWGFQASSFLGDRWKFQVLGPSSSRNFHTSSIQMMPEGPEVRTLVDQLQQGGAIGHRLVDIQFLSGRYVRHGRPRGFDEFAKTMTPWRQPKDGDESCDNGRIDLVEDWNAKGKFIYIVLDKGNNPPAYSKGGFQRSIWITLGMSGKFLTEKVHLQDPRFARWSLQLLDVKTREMKNIYYHDQRNFGTLRFSLSREELEEKLNSLGPDILDLRSTTEEEFLAIAAKQRPELNICKFLMDQSKISGIGNYILSECLYRASIDPFASLHELSEDQRRSVFREARDVAFESYQSQGLTRKGGTHMDMDGNPGNYQFELQCYSREICAKGDPVVREVNGPHKRSIWYVENQLFMPLEERATLEGLDPRGGDRGGDSKELVAQQRHNSLNLQEMLKEESWKNVLSEALNSDSFKNLEDFLAREATAGATIYPPKDDIFSAFNLCIFQDVKAVIVGQDPYHGEGQGHGLAFSVQKGIRPPPSLQNIVREAMDDVSIPEPTHGNLESWAKQGVLLLNTVLTVRQGEANSHKGQGWEDFTDQVIRVLNDRSEGGLVFLLWGNPAAKKASCVDETKHVVIRTSHPSPLGATKTASPFLGSRCFSRANHALMDLGQEPIDWSVR